MAKSASQLPPDLPEMLKVSFEGITDPQCPEAKDLNGDYFVLRTIGPQPRWQLEFAPICGIHAIEVTISLEPNGYSEVRVSLTGKGACPSWTQPRCRRIRLATTDQPQHFHAQLNPRMRMLKPLTPQPKPIFLRKRQSSHP